MDMWVKARTPVRFLLADIYRQLHLTSYLSNSNVHHLSSIFFLNCRL